MTEAKRESGVAATAELIEDRGVAAESDEFFRSRPFLDAEGATHTLRIASGERVLLAPLIVREVSGANGARDAISPYGYPGVSLADGSIDPPVGGKRLQRAIDPVEVDFSATGLVSIFIRHTLAKPPFAGAAERNTVQIADPALPTKRRSSDRNRINKNRRAGYEVEIVPGPETTAEQRAGFLAAYEQTMRRTEAAERYFFDAAYFDRLFEAPATWLALAHAPGGGIAAGSLLARSDGFLHYYLSGSADPHLRDSPMKNLVAALVDHAAELNLPLNLGGGLAAGDALEEFKRGFANRTQTWQVSQIICDPEIYNHLSPSRAQTGFFPAYRAPKGGSR